MDRDKIIEIFEKYASHPERFPSGSDQVCRYDWNKIADKILALDNWISVEDSLPEGEYDGKTIFIRSETKWLWKTGMKLWENQTHWRPDPSQEDSNDR